MVVLNINSGFPIADHISISLLQEEVFNNHRTIDCEYYGKVLNHFENILVTDSLNNVYISPYNKSIFINIIYNDKILKKIKSINKNIWESDHATFLDKLVYLLIKSYLLNINNYNYKSISITMIHLLAFSKVTENETTFNKERVVSFLFEKHDILKDIIIENVADSYKDISSMCIDIVKTYQKEFPLRITLEELLLENDRDIETKIKYLQCLNLNSETKKKQEARYIRDISAWLELNTHICKIDAALNSLNNNISLLKYFITNYEDQNLWNLLVKCLDNISPYITGDPNTDTNNENVKSIAFKIYKTIIEIMFKIETLYLKIYYLHTLLLTLSNSACIHVTIPLYKNLLVKTRTVSKESHAKLLDHLSRINYSHFGRRFGALPLMYQQLYTTMHKNDFVPYCDKSLTAMNFEIKLAIVPYLSILDELQSVFRYNGKEDYVIDTYIVRYVTGLVAYIVSSLKKSNYQCQKEAINFIVDWINNDNPKKEKLLLSILTQLVKYGFCLKKLAINWKLVAKNKNWLIRKAGAELYYICNFRGFNLNSYIKSIKLNENSNQLQFYLFVLNEYTKENLCMANDISTLNSFFKTILLKNNCLSLQLQVLKTINASSCLMDSAFTKSLVRIYIFENINLHTMQCGVKELIVKELIQLLKEEYLVIVLNSSYYEIAIDFILLNSITVEPFQIELLTKLYEKEKYDFIKLKILKILELCPSFNDYEALIKKTDNYGLETEYKIFNLDQYWNFYSDEDESIRLIALKKAVFSKSVLKQYQFEQDNGEEVSKWYKHLNLERLQDSVSRFSADIIKKELEDLYHIILKEININYKSKNKTMTLFEKDNFHNSSNLWWYIYTLTRNNKIHLDKDFNMTELNDSTFDIRILMLYRISGCQKLDGFYGKCLHYL